MSNAKRLNLYFNLNNKNARKAYKIITSNVAKTSFIIDAVLLYENNKEDLDKRIIKEALKEAISEMDNNSIDINKTYETKEKIIPDDIFNMIMDL